MGQEIILYYRGWDRKVVPKRQYEITTTCRVMSQKISDLIYLEAEVWNHA